MSTAPQRSRITNPTLVDWMQEVLKQADLTAQGFAADPVHDLRVAIRRCRSIAEGLRAMDPDPRWKKMRRSAKELFASLGRLRDSQVMMEWIAKLVPGDDPSARTLIAYCQAQEESLKREAEVILDSFDRKQWQSWARVLPQRAARVQLETEPFLALALERWMQARRLHNVALRTGRYATLHRLRIGVKKFRYVVEHFLPELHELWKEGLKRFQDLLGEVQDLTVLWETAVRLGTLEDHATRERWERLVLSEREARIERYRLETSSKNSLWQVWRSGLPRGKKARDASLKKLQLWASFHDPDVRHSRRIGRLAMQIHEGLIRLHLMGKDTAYSRELLRAASSVIGVGRSGKGKDRPKLGERIIRRAERPLTWKRQDLTLIAAIARFHRGPLPPKDFASLRGLSATQRDTVRRLIGVVRLASALAEAGSAQATLTKSGGYLVISPRTLTAESNSGESLAAARYLLELSLGMPIFIHERASKSPLKKGLSKLKARRRRS